jgi:rhodanese-related sulfurtransferase
MKRRIFLMLLVALALPVAAARAWQGGGAGSDRISLADFKQLLADGKQIVILDVRGEIDSKIKGAKHIPLDQLEARMKELPEGREIVTYCA